MASRLLIAVTGLFALVAGHQSLADTDSDQRCAKGADVRRIEIRFADQDGGLPCKVVYRPEAESDTLGIVSWQDLQSAAACEAQANEVIERLTEEGWTCAADDALQTAQDSAQAQSEAAVGSIAAEQDAEAASQPVATPEDPTSVDAAASQRDQTPIDETPIVEGEDDNRFDEVDESAELVANTDLPPPSGTLTAMIEQDLARLDVTLDGSLEATVAAYGDLNADDIEDALVLYTYRSPQPAYRQFLVAYVFDGETYQLTATRPVSGNVSATMDARIETIDRGVIHMALKAFEPGDASCCPSGTRYLALALRDLDLVEIDAEAPTR
ncbi:MAG: hypothetical protein ACR2RA_16975 [Geminicoccaceae bacterium]